MACHFVVFLTLQTLLQHRVVGILLLKLRQQYLDILQLTGFFPVLNQQHPGLAVGGLVLNDLRQLLLRRLKLVQGMQGNRQIVAIVVVVGCQLGAWQG